MSATYDFGDGQGPVPAHQHPNGGGWVADTAQVAPTAYVGPYARVGGSARVMDAARVADSACVMGPTDCASIGPVGSRCDTLTAYRTAEGGIEYVTGCFQGSYEALRHACLATHGLDSPHTHAYGRAATALWFLVARAPYPEIAP